MIPLAVTVAQEAQAFIPRDYAAVWKTMSPRFRMTCDKAAWMRGQKTNRDSLGNLVTFTTLAVTVSGRTASVSYAWAIPGQRWVFSGDRYVKVGDRWYDDLDALTTC